MVKQAQVVAVRVEEPGTMEQHITDFELENGTQFNKPSMIGYLLFEPDSFYTRADGLKVNLMISHSESGAQYVKTVGDSTKANNLLSLRRF